MEENIGNGYYLFYIVPKSTADASLRRIIPSDLVEGPPHEKETCSGEREVRCHIYSRPSPRVVNDDSKLGTRQVEPKSIHPRGERYLVPMSQYITRSSLLASNLAEVWRKLAEADEVAIRQGNASQQVPGSVFVRNGLEIEEQQ